MSFFDSLPKVSIELARKPAKPGRSGLLVVTGNSYGKVQVVTKRRPKTWGKYLAFKCLCRCGQDVYLRQFDLKIRKEHNLGCLLTECPLDTEESKREFGSEFNLRGQIDGLLNMVPHEVCSMWGGLADTDHLVSRGAGREAMFEYVVALTNGRRSAWHIKRKDVTKPYRKGNVLLCQTDEEVYQEKTVEFNGMLLSANELCEMFDVDLYKLLQLVNAYGTGATLIEKLTEEQQACLNSM